MRYGTITLIDWKFLLSRSVNDKLKLELPSAVKLSRSNKDVSENNFRALQLLGNPIAITSAMHSNKKTVKCSSDDMSRLVPKLSLSNGARVMLTRNLWADVGLCNGAEGTVESIVYKEYELPPDFPIAILVKFDSHIGPSFFIRYTKSCSNTTMLFHF